ncbi:MAG TPA: cytochrome c biogenesis protein ResB [Pyrinomonadaceae bacterium]|nr:cytochrome c biogenesis protein ResB [Pyrinomonadaceae bacterium]
MAKENLIEQKFLTQNAEIGNKPTVWAFGAVVVKTLRWVGSVRFGIVMLLLLLLCCLIGMFIMQQNMNGFREYYQNLMPAQRLVYGSLGFFDIYHSWYFTVLLTLTGSSILLASIFRFSKAWKFLRHPKLIPSQAFITSCEFRAESEVEELPEKQTEQIIENWRALGFKAKINKQGENIILFAQRNAWNRLGVHTTHFALIVIFIGGLLTSFYSSGGMLEIIPGQSSNQIVSFEGGIEEDQIVKKQLPFKIECTDLRQELIKPEGGLDPMNTVDWLSYIKIIDEGNEISGFVHLNEPFDYRGYRFFQSSFEPQGYAREITLSLQPLDGKRAPREVTIQRNQTVNVEGIGEISYNQFYPDFSIQNQKPITLSGKYKNPAVQLKVRTLEGNTQPTIAFNPALAREFYRSSVRNEQFENLLIADNQVILKNFEKVAVSHTLTVQYDLGRDPVYVGFVLLLISLSAVFLFSHQRVWALIQPSGNGSKVYLGGDTNRYKTVFQERFNSLVEASIRKGGIENE